MKSQLAILLILALLANCFITSALLRGDRDMKHKQDKDDWEDDHKDDEEDDDHEDKDQDDQYRGMKKQKRGDGDYIVANSKAQGSSNASKGGNAATVITSTAAASKLNNSIYKSKGAIGSNANIPMTNFVGQQQEKNETPKQAKHVGKK